MNAQQVGPILVGIVCLFMVAPSRAASQTIAWPTADAPVPDALVSFYAMGDVPYHIKSPDELPEELRGEFDYLRSEEHRMAQHLVAANTDNAAAFVVHLGDIKRGGWPCDEAFYLKTWSLLRGSNKPVFIIPGDNEWNDCSDPVAAWDYWRRYFATYDTLWTHDLAVRRRDAVVPDGFGFHFRVNGVVVVGINLTGFDGAESDTYQPLADNALIVIRQALGHAGEPPKALVVFGHASLGKERVRAGEAYARFVQQLAGISAALPIPTLYINGDAHVWDLKAPAFPGMTHLARLTVDEGGSAPPVRVTVTGDRARLFHLDRGVGRGVSVAGYADGALAVMESPE